jgi:hypothetical protein
MMSLRRRLERAARHPIIGPLVVVFLVLLMVLTIVHGTHDQLAEDGLACVGITFALMALARLVIIAEPLLVVVAVASDRAPPIRRVRGRALARARPTSFVSPLRL